MVISKCGYLNFYESKSHVSKGGGSRLNSSAKLPHHPPTKIVTLLTSIREIKSLRPNFEKGLDN